MLGECARRISETPPNVQTPPTGPHSHKAPPPPKPHPALLTAFCRRRESLRKAMLSAASSWVISSIFTLYFLICSLISISTHLWRRRLSYRLGGYGQHGGLHLGRCWPETGAWWLRQRPRDQAGPRTWLWLPSWPQFTHCVTSCSSPHLSEPESLS